MLILHRFLSLRPYSQTLKSNSLSTAFVHFLLRFLTLGRLNYHMLKNVEQRVCLRFRSININNFIMNTITAMGSYCFFCHCKDMALNKTNNSD